MKNLLVINTLYAQFHCKLMNFRTGISYLNSCKRICKELENSQSADLVHLMARMHLTYCILYSAISLHSKAIEHAREALKLHKSEIELRFKDTFVAVVHSREKSKKYKVTRMIYYVILAFLNIGLIREQQKKYPECVGAFKNGLWFAENFLGDKEYMRLKI